MADEMVLVVFSCSIESEMMDALKAAGMNSYTKIVGVQGVGTSSEPRLDSHVWPGTNTMLLICVDSDGKERLLQTVRQMKDIHREEGVKAFVLPVTSSI
ncbi:MAG: PG0541 family transporter-associated protein [Candidatus Eisenbacteria bacterium]